MNWSPPPGLQTSPPRSVRLTSSGIFLMVAALAFVAGGIALGIKLGDDSTSPSKTILTLQEQGAETGAKVERLWRTGRGSRVYRVTYQFGMEGRIFRGDAQISRQLWETLSEGSNLQVRYLPSNPMMNRPAESSHRPLPMWLPWALPVFFWLISLLMWVSLRSQKRLLENGRIAAGTVTEAKRVKRAKYIRYEFQPQDGSKTPGKGMAKKGEVEPGSEVTVVYDPDNPAKNAPYPFELVRPEE